MFADRLDSLNLTKIDMSNGIDIWHTNMDSHEYNSYLPYLTRVERIRANRIINEEKRHHLILSRGILRTILGNYLNIDPSRVNIEIQPNGKPVLADNLVYFNVTHSRELLVIAVSQKSEIGIDIEWNDHGIEPFQSASIVFSQEEFSYLEERSFSLLDYFKLWTLKEAVLKAAGWGFSYPSNSFSVISSKDHSFQSSILCDVTKGLPCFFQSIDIFPGFTGAMAELPKFENLARN